MVLFSNLKIPKKPFFQAFFTLLLLYLSQQNHALNGIPFVPQKLRNFPANIEHRKIKANPL